MGSWEGWEESGELREQRKLRAIVKPYKNIRVERAEGDSAYLTCDETPDGIDLSTSWGPPVNPYAGIITDGMHARLRIGPLHGMGDRKQYMVAEDGSIEPLRMLPLLRGANVDDSISELQHARERVIKAIHSSAGEDEKDYLQSLPTVRAIEDRAKRQQRRYSTEAERLVERMRGGIAAWATVAMDGRAAQPSGFPVFVEGRLGSAGIAPSSEGSSVLIPFWDHKGRMQSQFYPFEHICEEYPPKDWFAGAVNALWSGIATGQASTNLDILDRASEALSLPELLSEKTQEAVRRDLERLHQINDKLLSMQALEAACDIIGANIVEERRLPTWDDVSAMLSKEPQDGRRKLTSDQTTWAVHRIDELIREKGNQVARGEIYETVREELKRHGRSVTIRRLQQVYREGQSPSGSDRHQAGE